jgi:hypothetical protein
VEKLLEQETLNAKELLALLEAYDPQLSKVRLRVRGRLAASGLTSRSP